ncbi:MAG: CDP-alcohol phosphatidyltransferase family protein [Chloroflexi bacterium]|nr:CDP-alcohol phosphatidyltransferase family protein [Chloroflexota bacterium]
MRLGRIPPNAATLTAFGLGVIAVTLAAQGAYLWALGFWSLNRLIDAFDGLLARMQNQQSDFGGYLDILLDFAIYAALPIGLVVSAPSETRYFALAFLLGAFYVNGASWMYLAAIFEKRSSRTAHSATAPRNMTTVIMPSGLVGAVETFIAYCAFLLWPGALEWLYLGFGAMVLLTTSQRLVWAWRALR